MLIIFNLWAVVIGAIILIIWSLFLPFFPGLVSETWAPLVFGILTTVVGAIGEILGFKGRFFFLPIWLVGALIIGYQIGWIGIVSVLAFAVVLIVIMVKRAKKKEQTDWIAAKSTAIEYNPQLAANRKQLLAWGKKTMFLPIVSGLDKEMCEHDFDVLGKLQPMLVGLTADEAKTIAQFREFLEVNRAAASPASLDGDLRGKIIKVIVDQGKDRKVAAPGRSDPFPTRIQPVLNSVPPPLPSGGVKLTGNIHFEPQTSLENEIYALKYGGASREKVVATLLQSQLIVLQSSPHSAQNSHPPEISVSEIGGNTWVAVFTSISRASSCAQQSSTKRLPVQMSALDLVGRMRNGTGMVVNPGWDFDLRITPQEIEGWVNARRG